MKIFSGKNCGYLLLVDLPCKDYGKKFFREKENIRGQKFRSTKRKEVHQRRNS